MEDALPENDSLPLPQNATVIHLPVLSNLARSQLDLQQVQRQREQQRDLPYDRLVRELIDSTGIWTSAPAVIWASVPGSIKALPSPN